jgi:diguanylate cyclase (GGDEF)-like protein
MAVKNERLDHLASHDTLTGIPNRRFFFEEAERSLLRARRLGKSMALLVIDLRKFKLVNDNYGHSVGDALLCNFARRLQAGFREVDFVARLGGDEFAVILSLVEGQEGIDRAIARFLETPEEPLHAEGTRIYCECDIGAASYPEQAENVIELYEIADRHMYQTKHQSANVHG